MGHPGGMWPPGLSHKRADRWLPNWAAHSTSRETYLAAVSLGIWYVWIIGGEWRSVSDWQSHAASSLWAFKENLLGKNFCLQKILFVQLYIGVDDLEKNPIGRKCWLGRQTAFRLILNFFLLILYCIVLPLLAPMYAVPLWSLFSP